jgi:hypothetical protein
VLSPTDVAKSSISLEYIAEYLRGFGRELSCVNLARVTTLDLGDELPLMSHGSLLSLAVLGVQCARL